MYSYFLVSPAEAMTGAVQQVQDSPQEQHLEGLRAERQTRSARGEARRTARSSRSGRRSWTPAGLFGGTRRSPA